MMARRKLLGRTIFMFCILVLLVPALWERYQRDFMELSVAVPPPPRPFVELGDELKPLEAPDTRAYFAKLYANDEQKIATSDMPGMDELTSETPRAWVVRVGEYADYSVAQQFESQLRIKGIKSYVVPQQGQVGPFSVMVGPFLDYQRSTTEAQRVNDLLSVESVVLKFKP